LLIPEHFGFLGHFEPFIEQMSSLESYYHFSDLKKFFDNCQKGSFLLHFHKGNLVGHHNLLHGYLNYKKLSKNHKNIVKKFIKPGV